MTHERSKEEHAAVMERIAGVLRDALAIIKPGTELNTRKMFGGMGYYVDGRMFGGYYGDGLALKLAEDDRAALVAAGGAPGAMSKAAVEVPPALLDDVAGLAPWVAKSLAYARALPDKKRR